MELSILKQIINDNWDVLKNKILYINSSMYAFDDFYSFRCCINALAYNPAMTYRMELCTSDYPTAVSIRGNHKELDFYIKNRRFSQVKIFIEPIRENPIVKQPTEKAMEEFGKNN